MGTEITLDIGGITLSYSKNHLGDDHGSLFHEKDRKRHKSDQIDYDYFKETGEDPSEMEMAFIRPLREIVPRLELLGFNLGTAEHEYDKFFAEWGDEYVLIEDDALPPEHNLIGFEEFLKFVTQFPIKIFDNTYDSSFDEERESRIHGRFNDYENIIKLLQDILGSHGYSEASYFGNLISILHPYFVLRLLAENSDNLDEYVIWEYGPLVDAGWASGSEFYPEARREETFLIVTEGSSDTKILKKAFKTLRPQIYDFFRFIDVDKEYPFPGTGNLVNFAKGLLNINVQNKIIFLFDNDAVGLEAYNKLLKEPLPTNVRVSILPELDQFRDFLAQGPEGMSRADINRRAAAIECYLDLEYECNSSPRVIWTNYIESLKTYQGSLDNKASYLKIYLNQNPETMSDSSYNTEKIESLLDSLILECTDIATVILKSVHKHKIR